MKYTLLFRIWHWLNAFVVLALLGTVFLRKTFLSKHDNADILSNKLFEMGIEITEKQGIVLAKSIRSVMWEWHILLGYALAFLVLYRIYLYFFDKSIRVKFNSLNIHHKIVKISYYIVYIILGFLVVSGLVIHFYQDLGLSKGFAHDIKELHDLAYVVVLYFTPLHIFGVMIADAKEDNGLISTMIHGKRINK